MEKEIKLIFSLCGVLVIKTRHVAQTLPIRKARNKID